jgi:hypothetical protein
MLKLLVPAAAAVVDQPLLQQSPQQQQHWLAAVPAVQTVPAKPQWQSALRLASVPGHLQQQWC